MRLFDWLGASEVLPLAVAAVRVLATHGDREHRSRARLRHVRERIGADAFAALLQERFELAKAERTWPEADLPESTGGFSSRLALSFANGDITPPAADALAALAAANDVRVRIANHHRVIVFGRDARQLGEAVAALDPLTEAARPQAAIVACPGTRWCKRSLTGTNRLADRIREQLGERLTQEMTVCVSGCPNGCAHSAVADIGLIGVRAARNGGKQEAYKLLVGGGMGRNDELARQVAPRLSAEQALARISRLAQRLAGTEQH